MKKRLLFFIKKGPKKSPSPFNPFSTGRGQRSIVELNIGPSSFTNVRFCTKIEFSKVAKCTWNSRGAVSSATSLRRRPVEGSEG